MPTSARWAAANLPKISEKTVHPAGAMWASPPAFSKGNTAQNKKNLFCICAYTDVKDTGQVDEFGRPIYNIELQHVPAAEIILDPLSRLEDYSDARFIHRFKWTSKEDLIKSYGKTKVEELDSYNNHVDVKEADFSYLYNTEFIGKYRVYDNYLVTTIQRN